MIVLAFVILLLCLCLGGAFIEAESLKKKIGRLTGERDAILVDLRAAQDEVSKRDRAIAAWREDNANLSTQLTAAKVRLAELDIPPAALVPGIPHDSICICGSLSALDSRAAQRICEEVNQRVENRLKIRGVQGGS